MNAELVNLVLVPAGLGLLGFIEPCSIGASLLFLGYVEREPAPAKIAQAVVFTLVRAVFIGVLGIGAAIIGTAFIGLQKAGWIALGVLYAALGVWYLAGRADGLKRTLGLNLSYLAGTRGTVALALLFGLNIPACAAPLLVALLGSAAVGAGGLARAGQGFLTLAIFGLALSAPLALAMLWRPARDLLDGVAARARRMPLVLGPVFVGLGIWSAWFGLFVSPLR